MKDYKTLVFLAIIFFASIYLLFTNLDSRSFWTGDEATSVFVSRSIAKYGLPYCFYNDKIIEDENLWCKNKIYTEYLWLHNYLSAASIFLLGFSVFSARLPFAILGVIFVFLAYYITRKNTQNQNLAILTSIVALTTVYYLLLFRVARYYGVALVWSVLFIDSYLTLVQKNKKLYFLIVSSLMILNHFGMFLVQILSIFVYHFITIFNKKKFSFYQTCALLLPIVIFFLTFILFGQENIVKHQTGSLTIANYVNTIYYFTTSLFKFFLPLPLLFILLILRWKNKNKQAQFNNFALLNTIILLSTIFIASFRGEFYYLYIPAGYSILFLLSYTIYSVYQHKKMLGTVLGIIVIFTNAINILPICFQNNAEDQSCTLKSPFFEYVLYELQEDYADPQELIVDYFNRNVSQGDTLTYGGSEAWAIYYFTRMNVTPSGRSDYAIYFNVSLDPTSKYDIVKEFNYTSLFPINYFPLSGHPDFYSWEFKGKSPFPEDHRFSIQTTKTFRLYKLKNNVENNTVLNTIPVESAQ